MAMRNLPICTNISHDQASKSYRCHCVTAAVLWIKGTLYQGWLWVEEIAAFLGDSVCNIREPQNTSTALMQLLRPPETERSRAHWVISHVLHKFARSTVTCGNYRIVYQTRVYYFTQSK